MTQAHRDKIANSKILNRLIRHAEGDEEMSQSEANTGLALLKKVMPDLKSVEHTGSENSPVHLRVTIGGE